MAGLVLCVMASLAGVPPFLGFWSKLAVLRAALQGNMLWLAIVGIVFAVIGSFYYLRVIKVMYFDEPVGDGPWSATTARCASPSASMRSRCCSSAWRGIR
jgi:NADH-quinone oxidoreductase subunit N